MGKTTYQLVQDFSHQQYDIISLTAIYKYCITSSFDNAPHAYWRLESLVGFLPDLTDFNAPFWVQKFGEVFFGGKITGVLHSSLLQTYVFP